MTTPCEQCGGTGFEIVSRDGREFAQACACRRPSASAARAATPLAAAGSRRATSTARSRASSRATPRSPRALEKAMAFCAGLPAPRRRRGAGPALQRRQRRRQDPPRGGACCASWSAAKGARGQFWDFHELIREIKSSYDPETKTTELQVLEPVVETDVLLLDDLGAWKMTDWMNDTLFYILNSRYMAKRPTAHHHELPGRDARGGARRRPAAAARVPGRADRPAPALAAHGDVPGRAHAGQRPPPGPPAGEPGRAAPAVARPASSAAGRLSSRRGTACPAAGRRGRPRCR